MEALAQSGLHGPRPRCVRLAERRHAAEVIVREELGGRGIEILHPEGGEHFLFVFHGAGAAGPPGRRTLAVEADLVGEECPRGRLGDAGRTPPSTGLGAGLVVFPIQLRDFGRAATDAT